MSAPRTALPVVFGAGLLLALAVRLAALPFVSGDMRIFHVPWSEAIEREGAWRALALNFSNYPPLYLYALTAATWLPLPRVWAIKLVHGVFDLVLAAYAAGIVGQLARGAPASGRRGAAGIFGDEASPPRWAFLAVLLLPTVVMNAALWGQCDAMYAAGLVAGVHYVIAGRPAAGMVALGLAFSLKPQAVFLGPWVVLLTLRGRIRWPHWYLVPATYLLCAAPALLAGRPFGEILLLYPNQPILPFPSLTLGATNLYQWLSDRWFGVLYPAGLALSALAALAYVVVLHRRWPGEDREDHPHPGPLPVGEGEGQPPGREPRMEDRLQTGPTGERGHLLATALLAVLLMPYVLPAMHERYFFPADVLALVAAWTLTRFVPAALLVLTASSFTYLPYLFEREPLPRPLLAALMTLAIVLTAREVLRPCSGDGPGASGGTGNAGQEYRLARAEPMGLVARRFRGVSRNPGAAWGGRGRPTGASWSAVAERRGTTASGGRRRAEPPETARRRETQAAVLRFRRSPGRPRAPGQSMTQV